MEFLSYLISGISLGSVYAIIALGYTMVYGIAKMLNFAHGDVIMIGGYVSFCAMFYLGLPNIVAVLMAVVVCTVLGIVIERLAYKPLRSAPSLAVLITAIGVSYFLQNSALLIWKAAARSYPPVVTGAVKIFGGKLTVSYISLLTISACVIIMIALTLFVSKSKMGKAMRACSENKDAARLHEMLCSWQQAAAMLEAGEISKEDYDKWRYHYPEFDKSQNYVKVPPQDLF